jgi:predicted  nucleic acid-binding Zn-ribbon protein
MAASKGEQAMNPQYEAHARLCKSIGDMAKENEDLKQHVTELENRLRALWDKLEGERKHYMEQIRRLEEAGNELMYDNDDMANINRWRKAKEAKP